MDRIDKQPDTGQPAPRLGNYERTVRGFSWDAWRRDLAGLPGGGVNIAFEAVTRHVRDGNGERTALRCLDAGGSVHTELDYAALDREAARFANLLEGLGCERGERVCTLLGREPALYVAALGTLRAGLVLCPLFSAFGPGPAKARMRLGAVRVLVTTRSLYERRVLPVRDELPALEHVLLAGEPRDDPALPGTRALAPLLEAASSDHGFAPTGPEDPALLHFTSGTTGPPKGAIHVHEAVLGHYVSACLALDLCAGDVFWCTADPGWVTGTSYGIIAPLVVGATLLVDPVDFDPQRWYRNLARHGVNVWYTSPTAIRMLMRLPGRPREEHDFSRLRHVASVGEPLNPGAAHWSADALGVPAHDTWWQTETGAIMISNYRCMEIRPGSMGRPLPGVEAAILQQNRDGTRSVVDAPQVCGELALRRGWPSMFRAYLDDPQRYAECFDGRWYLSGDLARRDSDGYYWFVGRADDVIKSAGHLIGPFEVESALMEHPAVAEAGVIGKPDEMLMEVVKAFVALKPGHEAGDDLRRELLAHARRRLGPSVAPREIAFADKLPKTRSGKIMRRLLKARELGLPEGDLSALDEPAPHARTPGGEQ